MRTARDAPRVACEQALALPPQERRLAAACRRRFLEGMAAVRRERASITAQLQRSLALRAGEAQRTDTALSGHRAALHAESALRANLAAERACHQALGLSLCTVCTPIQTATAFTQACALQQLSHQRLSRRSLQALAPHRGSPGHMRSLSTPAAG